MSILLWFLADRADTIARPNYRKHALIQLAVLAALLMTALLIAGIKGTL